MIESTGLFLTEATRRNLWTPGAKKVHLSAPAKDDTPMFVFGVNHAKTRRSDHLNASCTTNCLAPVAKVLNDKWGSSAA